MLQETILNLNPKNPIPELKLEISLTSHSANTLPDTSSCHYIATLSIEYSENVYILLKTILFCSKTFQTYFQEKVGLFLVFFKTIGIKSMKLS